MSAALIAQIEAFLEGRLSKAALQKQAELEGVTNIDEEIQWFQDSQVAIEAAGLRDQLQEAFSEPVERKGILRQLGPLRTGFAIAASILLLIVVYWGMNSDSTTSLYATYEYVDPGLPVLMSQSDQHQLYDALSYYSEENYVVAAEKLAQLQDAGMKSDTIRYYLGASLLYQGKAEAAKLALKPVSEDSTSPFHARAQWLLVLSALKEDQLDEAQLLLPSIVDNPAHPFQEKAKQLQLELSKSE